jgi:hypothetical protein
MATEAVRNEAMSGRDGSPETKVAGSDASNAIHSITQTPNSNTQNSRIRLCRRGTKKRRKHETKYEGLGVFQSFLATACLCWDTTVSSSSSLA